MVKGPPPELSLVAPGAAAAFGTAKDVWLYIRHVKRHVRNLPHNFESLEHQMDLLHGRWKDINNSIDLQLATRQRNTQHQNWDRVVSWTLEYYQELTGTYKKAVGVQSDQNPATENQTPAALEHESDANPETESDADPETGNQTTAVGVQSAGNPATENQTLAALEHESDANPETESDADPETGNQTTAVGVQSAGNPATENQTLAALEHESDAKPAIGNQMPAVGVQSDRNPATEKQTPAALEHESDANPETGNQTPVRDLLDASKGWPKKWYAPLFRKFYKLASLDKDVLRFTPLVTSLRNEMKEENMTSPRIQQIVVREDAKEVSHISSHNRILGELRNLLQQNCQRIAIYGASQVGKTNILKNLNNGPLSLQFDHVIWVTFPTHLEKKEEIIKNIQDKILLRLNLTAQSSASRNADLISEALSAESYLLLFDGFSSSIMLNEIGIFRWHNRGKVVIETENQNRLRNVEFDGFIEVKCLSDEDSRMLFVKIIENEIFCNDNRALVDLILNELGGHPGVIASMADWLKCNMKETFWKAVMRKLKADVGEPDLLGLGGQKNVFDITYKERLTEDRYRRCLLYAALFPKSFTIPINVLVECWKAEDFLSCPLPTFIEARGDGEIILNKLTGLYLLEYCSDSEQYVKMPINFRRVARHTPFPGEEGEPSFVRSGPEIDGHLNDEEWVKARRVSLMQSKLQVLPTNPKCMRMSTLFLQLNPELEIIRETFFRTMQNLRVLDLHSTGIKLLPPTISYLTALRSLYLNNCGDLTVLPDKIVELKKLEVLDIRFTLIHCVPDVMSGLVGLRCLRFSFVPEACNPNPERDRIFSPGTADQLNKLEELIIVLVNGRNDGIYDQIEAEVPKFKIKKDQFKLIPARPAQSLDPTTGTWSPSSDNEDSSRGGRTGANSPARTKDKGKEQVDAIDRSKFSAGASTSGIADGAD